MKTTNFALLILSMVLLSMQTVTGAAASESCPIAKSIYRDADGKGFQLVFGPPPPRSPFHATAAIAHPQLGQLYRFQVTQSSGYGSIWLLEQDRSNSKRENRFWITFFDRDLKSATPIFLGQETESPRYAVIAELGSHDYYQRRGTMTQSTPPLLPDVMWIHDRCQ
ncbi:hypothetical protein TUMEXPCC7403_16095 [Tumidithrix helvetica PCC 7403]|uniref:hypothetical protein n=1 Tax=Tumidithrix helvetica TaxID=3457545 RepID=UPI003C7F4BB5